MRIENRTSRPTETAPAPSAAPEAHGLYRLGIGYGRAIYRLRWVILAIWIVGLAISAPFAAKIGSVLTGGGYSLNTSESVHASNIINARLHQPASQVLVVFQSATAQMDDPSYQREITDFTSRVSSFPHLTRITPAPIDGQDGKTTYVNLSFNSNVDTTQKQLTQLRSLLPSSGPAKAYLTGDPAVYAEFNTISEQDTRSAEEAALPIAGIVLLIVFGTLVAAALPLLLALVAVPVALAVIYAIAVHASTNVFVLNVASIVGLGISIDYSLFMTRRFREELARGRSRGDAVGWTVATAGEAILFSGLTVMIGFTGLLLIGIPFMTSFGIGGAVVVAAAVLAALTLLPALLGILGPRVNALRIPVLGKLLGGAGSTAEESERPGLWHTLAMGVMRRPVVIVVFVTAVLIALASPALSMNIGTPSSSALPASSNARKGLDILAQQYPGSQQQQVQLVAQTPDGGSILTADHLAAVRELSAWVAAQPHITGVTSVTRLPVTPGAPALTQAQLTQLYVSGQYQQVPGLAALIGQTTGGDTTVITATANTTLDSTEGKALIDHLRADDKANAPGLNVYVGGLQAISLDFNRYLYGNFPKAILYILVATYVLLLLMFRSVVLPLKAILMNVLSVGAAYGALVFIFQQGHFASQLGFSASGTIDSTIPILLFCILFGLSMDYEVFLLSRIREEWLRTHNNRYAVARGLEKTGGVITSAALLFVIVTGAFTFTTLTVTKEIGLGMTIAVLVDATIIRSLLVPATMRLIGRWNWWFPGLPLPKEQSV